MNKPCARPDCGKIVYPMDELKCLDKVWHKQCFRCTTCHMVLNMKNYKGYEKSPYCDAHYPKTKASVVTDTPENRRLAENTKNQSLVKYHEDFEKAKGKKTEIPDDPEVQRHLKNTQIVSQVAYHGDVERKEQMEKIRPPIEETIAHRDYNGSAEDYLPQEPVQHLSLSGHVDQMRINDPIRYNNGYQPTAPYQPAMIHNGPTPFQQAQFLSGYRPVQSQTPQSSRPVGTLDDYDPLHGKFSSIVTGRPTGPPSTTSPPKSAPVQNQPSPVGQSLHTAGFVPAQKSPQHSPAAPVQQQPQQHYPAAFTQQPRPPQAAQQPFSPPAQQPQQQQVKRPPSAGGQGTVVRAIYDYTAADIDEISFNEGDIIVNCARVDEGWMTGTVQRTGKFGMLPANYVERVH